MRQGGGPRRPIGDVQTDVHIVPVDSDSPLRNLLKVQTVRCALVLYKGNYIPSPAPNFQYKEVNRLRIVVRDLARILRVPDWAFVTANVTVRLKWRPFVNAENHGKHKYAWQITFRNPRVFLPKRQLSNGQGSRPISCLMILPHRQQVVTRSLLF